MKTQKVNNTDSTKNQKDRLGTLSWIARMQLVPERGKLRNLKSYRNFVQ